MRSFFLVFFCFIPGLAMGQSFMSSAANNGPQAWVRGGSGVATSLNDEAFTINPAGLVKFLGTSTLGGSWSKTLYGIDRWNVNLVDGTRPVVGGISFDWTEQRGIRQMGIRPGAAYRTKYGSFGTSFDILNYDGTFSNDGWYISNTTGIYVPVVYNVAVAASIKSFLDNAPDSVLPPELKLGAVFQKEKVFQVSFQADRRFEVPNQDWNYSTSLELYFQKFYALQGGVRFENSGGDGSYWSAGLLMAAPKINISGFYTREINRSKDGFGFGTTFLF